MIVVGGESLVDLVIDSRGGVTPRLGGGPYNAARAVSRLGQPCLFLGRFGNDRFGQSLKSAMIADGVALACPEFVEAPSTLAIAEISECAGARYRFYLAETAASMVSEADARRALAALDAAPAGSRAVHVGTLGLVMEPIATSLETLVKELAPDAVLMLDPNCRPAAIADLTSYRQRLARLLARADLVKLSQDDLAFLVPGIGPDEAARTLLAVGPAAVLLTRGSEPTMAITAAGSVEVPVPRVPVVDTIGAGDSFGGAFVAWWLQQGLGREDAADLELLATALPFATAVAAITCQRAGADPPRLADLDATTRRAWNTRGRVG